MIDFEIPEETKKIREEIRKFVQEEVIPAEKECTADNFESVTNKKPTAEQFEDMIFANKLVKHTKSNTIVLAKNGQLLASGTGQTSRVDALNQAINKGIEDELKENFDEGFNEEGAGGGC